MQPRDELLHPATGERFRFEQTAASTGGERLVLVDHWPPGHRVPPHVHPLASERWQVLEGDVTIVIDGVEHRLGPGGSVVAAAGTTHRGANVGSGWALLRLAFTPAGRWEEVIARLVAGPHDDHGRPTPGLVLALLADFPDDLAPPTPS